MRIKYTRELLQKHVPHVTSNAELARRLGLAPTGSNTTNLGIRCRQFNIDTSHFTGSAHNRGKRARNRLEAKEVFALKTWNGGRITSSVLTRALLESGIIYHCKECGLGDTWTNKPLKLQVDHIDGDFSNNKKNNLRFICPNCHTQTKTWGRNK